MKKRLQWMRGLLGMMALYDGVLGVAFLVAAPQIYRAASITSPNHWGYVQFSAALLIIFALMFLEAARRPAASRSLLFYGLLLKISYVGVVGGHWFFGDNVPFLWKPFAVADLMMAVALAWMWRATGRIAAARG